MSEPYYGQAEPPNTSDLNKLRLAAKRCTACHLWKCGTQTVFGEGNPNARLMLVGEQPGDKEDIAGKPFVGPAGALLEKCLTEAGVDGLAVYMTNAVKHFKWVPKGSRRIHSKPNRYEVEACLPWLESEIRAVRPEVILCLGATAAQALVGNDFKVTRHRGELLPSSLAKYVLATVHPSSILRAGDESREDERKKFVRDLKVAAKLLRPAQGALKSLAKQG